jgi:hypothetical protein
MPAGGGAHLNAGGRREAASELLGQTEVGDEMGILQIPPGEFCWYGGLLTGPRWAVLGCTEGGETRERSWAAAQIERISLLSLFQILFSFGFQTPFDI